MIATEISRLGSNGNFTNLLRKSCQVITIKENYNLGNDIQSKFLTFAFSLNSEIERKLISQRTICSLETKKQE